MNYKNTITGIFLAASVAVAQIASVANAADLPAAKVVVVDIQKVVRSSTAEKQAAEAIEKKRAEFQAEITKQEESLKKKDQDLTKQKATLAADAFEQRRKALQKDVLALQENLQKKRIALDNASAGVLQQIQNSVLEIIKTLAKERGFDVAIPTAQVLYGNEALDISDEVLKRLDLQLPKVDIEVKEPVASTADPKAAKTAKATKNVKEKKE